MTDLPARVTIYEQGSREGFQFEKGPIATVDKIGLIDRLSVTGLTRIQVASFVDPRRVPGWADADAVVAGITQAPGVTYTGSYLNERGLERAIATGRLTLIGALNTCASEPFLVRNQNQTIARNAEVMRDLLAVYRRHGIAEYRGGIMAAFGCNFAGDVPLADVLAAVVRLREATEEAGVRLGSVSLQDTMAWGNPAIVARTIGAIRERWPDLDVELHLHDTRGLAVANAYAGLGLGVTAFDASVGGLGGCPFGGHKGAAGNICTEDLAFLCAELGIETGIDLDAMIEAARFAETIVGHELPGSVMHGGRLPRQPLAA